MADPIDFSNSAVLIERADLERFAEGLTASAHFNLIAAAIITERLDTIDGDPDREDDDPAEHDGSDQGDQAWIEWQNTHPSTRGQMQTVGYEDDEEDDAPGDSANEDEPNGHRQAHWNRGAGCPISDPGGDEHDGREPDDGY